MFEQFRWEIERHKAVPGPEGLRRNEVRFRLPHLIPRFTIYHFWKVSP
jgi:hypothetical protein